ncbi:MAG: THUMP domain-containing protein [Bdellovibrionota bacterium]
MSQYFATTSKGIEPITAEELRSLGANEIHVMPGGVSFEGDQRLLYRACLSLRSASRVLVQVREFAAKTPEMLYDQVRRVKWQDYLDSDKTFSVDCTISSSKRERELEGDKPSNSRLSHSHFVALKIKDAIVDQLRLKQGARPNVDVKDPDLRVNAYLKEGRCILSFDASGPSLHERGYRIHGALAPLKENLAAAVVAMSGWDGKSPFIDPMCGSGTLVIEAALKALNIAPGLYRKKFGFFRWPDFNQELWREVLEEARQKALKKLDFPIVGYDVNARMVASALENAAQAGLSRVVHFERRSIEALQPVGKSPGVIIVNPPYGERIGEEQSLQALYKTMGDAFKQRMKNWKAFVLTGNLELAKHVGLKAARRHILFNGPIECRLLRYDLY